MLIKLLTNKVWIGGVIGAVLMVGILYLSTCEIKAHYFTKRLSGILNPA